MTEYRVSYDKRKILSKPLRSIISIAFFLFLFSILSHDNFPVRLAIILILFLTFLIEIITFVYFSNKIVFTYTDEEIDLQALGRIKFSNVKALTVLLSKSHFEPASYTDGTEFIDGKLRLVFYDKIMGKEQEIGRYVLKNRDMMNKQDLEKFFSFCEAKKIILRKFNE